MQGDRESFLEAGFDGYISKPIDVPEFIQAVARYCDGELAAGHILVVDDVPENVRLMEAVLVPRGYTVVSATNGQEALELVERERPDLILLDVVMPGMDGYAVCQALREGEDTAVLPVIMVTSSIGPEKKKAIEAGADDFIPKPFNHDELLVRVKSLLRIKRYHDTIKAQAAELLELNRTLEERVERQVTELERLRRLRRFLSPQLADAIVSSGDESILKSHRRQVAVLFADLRGYTNFADSGRAGGADGRPRRVSRGDRARSSSRRRDRRLPRRRRVELFFNDPIEISEPALRAVRLAGPREEMEVLRPSWVKRGHELDFGVGIAFGYATLGEIGFEGRSDYAAIGWSHPRLASVRRGHGRPDPGQPANAGRSGGRGGGGGGRCVHPEGVRAARTGLQRPRDAFLN